MKKLLIVVFVLALAIPMTVAMAADDFVTAQENVESAVDSVRGTGGDLVESIASEAAKGTNPAEHVTGVAVGGIKGLRKGIHRLGAGAIDLLTFWIPKKEPLIAESTFE